MIDSVPLPYLSTNHHSRTLPISSTSSKMAVTRSEMTTFFVSLCSATSFRYASSISLYARPLADAAP